jgi:hypothetical protein
VGYGSRTGNVSIGKGLLDVRKVCPW